MTTMMMMMMMMMVVAVVYSLEYTDIPEEFHTLPYS
jgi:hypothetical protein